MMRLEEWGGSIFGTPLPVMVGGVCGPLRTHLTRRSREDIFLPEQTSLNFLSAPSACYAESGTTAVVLLLRRNSVPRNN
jgi:hypothetical protein